MNTIPSTFNERQMQCIILGNQKDAKPREIKIPMTVIVLKSGKNHFLDDFFGKLLCYGFEKIIYVDKDNHHSLEGKAIKFPSIEFIIPLERITVGEMINLGIASSNSEKNLVLWDNIKLSATLLKQDFLEYLFDSDKMVICPELESNNGQKLPTASYPLLHRKKIDFPSVMLDKEVTDCLYPFDFMGIYSRSRFVEVGGFDTTIFSAYWQNLDFALRSWLFGEKIVMHKNFMLVYESQYTVEDTTFNDSYLRFYLKNIAPRIKTNYAYIPISLFFDFWFKGRKPLNEAKLEFNNGRKWVSDNKLRFKQDILSLVAHWGK
ncbi:MAG: hypothetical protein E7062_04610 [Spirochaetaceae bacterium]|nr:hypothetical protein [Spirochaetaceae bacterium]